MSRYPHPDWDKRLTELLGHAEWLRQNYGNLCVPLGEGVPGWSFYEDNAYVVEHENSVTVSGLWNVRQDGTDIWNRGLGKFTPYAITNKYMIATVRQAVAHDANKILRTLVRHRVSRLTAKDYAEAEPWDPALLPDSTDDFGTLVVENAGVHEVMGRVPEWMIQDYADERPLEDTGYVFSYFSDESTYLLIKRGEVWEERKWLWI